jgi:hypothetical protein
MSRQKYPRKGVSNQLPPPIMCSAIGCTKLATAHTFIQFTYMRGEDEGVSHCDDHALKSGHDPQVVSDWCKQFPTEAWK